MVTLTVIIFLLLLIHSPHFLRFYVFSCYEISRFPQWPHGRLHTHLGATFAVIFVEATTRYT